LALFAIILILAEICNALDIKIAENAQINEMLYAMISRMMGSGICVLMVIYASLGWLFTFDGRNKFKNFLLLIPCWLVAINNFPFISVINGTASLYDGVKWYFVALLALQCFWVGFFEEVAFRGCVFMLALRDRHKTHKDVLIAVALSSAIFGGVHLANLFVGASVISVFLQIGYSFLIGAMCAFALIITKKIWSSILMHAIFNFGGAVIPTLGNGDIWPISTVIVTAVLAVAVILYSLVVFIKLDKSAFEELFPSEDGNE
jgi:membrane protease YdiL (CAAX protease family)